MIGFFEDVMVVLYWVNVVLAAISIWTIFTALLVIFIAHRLERLKEKNSEDPPLREAR